MLGALLLGGILLLQASTIPRVPVGTDGSWSTHGPYGGTVEALVFDPRNADTVYAAVSHSWAATSQVGGVFKSTDGGVRWAPAGLSAISTYGLAIARSDPSVLIAASGQPNYPVWKSTDAGSSWTHLVDATPFAGVAIDPEDSAKLFLGRGDGLRKSVDGGATWAPDELLGDARIEAMAFDSNTPPTLYVAAQLPPFDSRTMALARSSDGGRSWAFSSGPFFENFVTAIAADPGGGLVLYAASGLGILKTVDGGQSWRTTATEPAEGISSLAVDPKTPETIYAGARGTENQQPHFGGGLYVSHDGGDSWARDVSLESAVYSVGATTGAGELRLYVGTLDVGVFRTEPGAGWVQRDQGITGCSALAIESDPRDPRLVYALTSAGFARSVDAGLSWSVDRSAPTGIYGAIAVDPSDSNVVFAAGARVSLVRSRDRGLTWETAFAAGIGATAIAFDTHDPRFVYIADYWPLKSADGGRTWAIINSGIDGAGVVRIEVDTADGSVLYASSDYGGRSTFYRSADGGHTWTKDFLVSSFGRITAIVSDPTRPGVVWVGTSSGLIRSTDSGGSWGGTDFPAAISTMTVDRGRGTLYAATPGNELFRSRDGETWEPFETNLAGLPIRSLAADPSGGYVYAATEQGVYAVVLDRSTRFLDFRTSGSSP